MAKEYYKKKSNGLLYFFLFIFLCLFLVGGYFLFRYEVKKQVPIQANNTIGALEIENAKLKLELDSAKSEQFRKTWSPVVIAGMVIAALTIIIVMLIKSRPVGGKKFLTIDEAKKKGYKLVEELLGKVPLWCHADSVKKKVGDNRLYFLTYGFYPKKGERPINYTMTKIIGILNDDWDHARIENIPVGYSLQEAIEHVMHENDLMGYPIEREPKTADVEAIAEAFRRRKEGDALFRGIGLEEGEETGG